MFLYIFYTAVGLYLLLLSLGLVPHPFWRKIPKYRQGSVRLAVFFFAIGLLLTTLYQTYTWYIVRPAAIKAQQRMP